MFHSIMVVTKRSSETTAISAQKHKLNSKWSCQVLVHIGTKGINGRIQPERCANRHARPRGYKTFFMLSSVEHEILNAHKYKNIMKFVF